MAEDSKGGRDQSTIQFPYVDLEEAIKLASVILARGGVALDRDQLAAGVNQVPNSGAFGAKVGAARMFGLIDSVQGKYTLTELGFEILDSSRERAAKAEAFLNVPLYKRVFDDFRGKQLPPRPHGLERALLSMGVAPKQKERARQIFDRSARTAGYFISPAEDRLVQPAFAEAADAGLKTEKTESSTSAPDASAQPPARPKLHFFIEGLLAELPPVKSNWSTEARAKWLDTAASAFDLIYEGSTGDVVIEVKTKPPSDKAAE